MNLRDLKYFLAVSELQHFGQAAEKCHVSQPTLSGQIKKIEEELGTKLFERTNRRVILTDTGKEIAIYAQKIMDDVDSISQIAENSHNPLSGKFKLGAFPTLSTYIFPELASEIKRKMPKLRLILIEDKTDDLLKKLKTGEIDAALLALPINDDFFVSQKLFDDEFYLAVPAGHKLEKHKAIDHSNLKGQSLLLLEEGHCLRDQALEVCQLHGIGEEQDFKATGLETLRQMVKVGTGVTFIPKIAINENDKGISYIPFKSPAPTRTIGLVWRKTYSRKEVLDNIIQLYSVS